MKVKIRKSSTKKSRMTGFLKRSRTKSGRNILKRRRSKGRTLTSK